MSHMPQPGLYHESMHILRVMCTIHPKQHPSSIQEYVAVNLPLQCVLNDVLPTLWAFCPPSCLMRGLWGLFLYYQGTHVVHPIIVVPDFTFVSQIFLCLFSGSFLFCSQCPFDITLSDFYFPFALTHTNITDSL